MLKNSKYHSLAAAARNALFGRWARRVYLAVVLGVAALSIAVRVRTYLLTRKIQAVLTGLAQVRVDVTTEEELRKTVPYLDPQPPAQGAYRVGFNNFYDWRWEPSFLFYLQPSPRGEEFPPRSKQGAMAYQSRIAYALGWRYLSFTAWISVSNGIVSRMGYDLEPDVLLGFPASYFVHAQTVHGFLKARVQSLPVDSVSEENPDFRFGRIAGEYSWLEGADERIGVAYTPNASRDLVAHVYQADLSCFWGIRGCDSVRQVVPLLWQDRDELVAKTKARFALAHPCPDEILAGRVRTLPDLTVALLEVVRSEFVEVNHEGELTGEIVIDYRLKEAIRGEPQGPWTGVRYRQSIPWKSSPTGMIANPIGPSFPKPGERFLLFGGAAFDSCRVVPATQSAERAVRSAVPGARRGEDYLMGPRK